MPPLYLCESHLVHVDIQDLPIPEDAIMLDIWNHNNLTISQLMKYKANPKPGQYIQPPMTREKAQIYLA